MQSKATIKKTETRTDIQYTNSKGFVIFNPCNSEITLGFNSSDTYVSVKTLEAALEMIGWEYSQPTTEENISWINPTFTLKT